MADGINTLTERAQKVLQLAQVEAQRFGHNYIGTEHLLLGLLSEREGVAARVLGDMGIKLNTLRSFVEIMVGCGDRAVSGVVDLTPRAKRVIELGVDEARRFNHQYVGTEHLLLGLVREGNGIAAGVLESIGVSLDKVRWQVGQVLSRSAAYSGLEVGAKQTISELVKISQQLDDGARRAFQLGLQNAAFHHDSYLGTEHLLLGLIGEGEGIAAQVLAALGVTREEVDEQLQSLPGEGDRKQAGGLRLTTRGKRAMELAVQEALSQDRFLAGTEHLLLGLVAEGEGVAVRILDKLGASPEAVRAAIERRLTSSDEA
jgi:ATP-dependent Clp protease ATP-binding subunit ClpA